MASEDLSFVLRRLRILAKRNAIGITLILLLLYFAYHSLHGDRGLIAYLDRSRQLEERTAVLDGLRARRAELETTVDALAEDRLDPDLVEERLYELGFVHRDEVIIFNSELGIDDADEGQP